ncbi:hypothetical protein OROGR_008886 [Orobanche gracilis]
MCGQYKLAVKRANVALTPECPPEGLEWNSESSCSLTETRSGPHLKENTGGADPTRKLSEPRKLQSQEDLREIRRQQPYFLYPLDNIYTRNMYYDKYWRLMPYWIRCDVTNPVTKNNDTLFEVVLCGDDTIALRSVDNKLFCTRTSMDNKDSVLCCQTPSINTWAMFKVSDFVLSRKIENIDFRIADAMIYNVKIVTLVTSSHINQGSTARESVFTLSYKQSTSSTWNSSISRMTNIKTTFKAVIPLIVDGGIEMGLQNSQVYTWGETKVEEQEISNSYKVVIPPNTKVKLRVMCTIGTCDVPFSYTQQDVLPTGETVTTKMDDGVYTGNNNYFFETQSKEESLVKDPNIPAQGFKTFVVMDGEMD